MLKVYHNNRCSKSRECLAFLDDSGQPYEVVKYLEEIPSADELKDIIRKLDVNPLELVRQHEPIWIDKFKGKSLTDQEIIDVMIAHPILIERPIVVNGDKAVIARPMGKISEIL